MVPKNSFQTPPSGSTQFKFRNILHQTKANPKSWNENINNKEINQIRVDYARLQDNIDLHSSDPKQINVFFHMQKKLANSLHTEAANLRQKAKVDWLINGDLPSKFFYVKMCSRKHYNDIGKLLNGNGIITNKASQLEKEISIISLICTTLLEAQVCSPKLFLNFCYMRIVMKYYLLQFV